MATPRKSTASRRRPASPGKPATELVELFTTDDADVEMVPLFSIDGVEHYIPAEPNAVMALRFIDRVKNGVDEYTAMGELLEELLGPESYQALMEFKGRMTPKQLLTLMGAAQAAVMGLAEGPKGS